MTYESLIDRWDAEPGAGIAGPAMDLVVTADAADRNSERVVSRVEASARICGVRAGRTLAGNSGVVASGEPLRPAWGAGDGGWG